VFVWSVYVEHLLGDFCPRDFFRTNVLLVMGRFVREDVSWETILGDVLRRDVM
jgi:hypothetical protein